VRSVTTRHGTQLAYHEYGDPAGRPIIFFHNSGSHVCAMLLHGPAAARGFRVIVPDRPGTGRSGFIPGWSALGFAQVVADLADVLGLGTFGAMGLSGGGPTLMAAAFSMPERLEFVVDLACAMPLYGDAAERAQLGAADRLYARLGAGLPLPLFQAPFSVIGLSQRLLRSPRSFARLFASSLCPADKALFAIPELQYVIMRDFQEFFRQGSRAAAYDAQVVYKDWGFALADVATHIEVYQGADDRFVPPRFSEYLARTAPDVRLTLLEGEGHFCHLADGDKTLARVAELTSAGPGTPDGTERPTPPDRL
jgi:pimeloyl-ACP methyl ester carboxylesterase